MSDYLKVDSFRLQQASHRSSSSSSAGTVPSERDVTDFEKAMQRPDEQRDSGEHLSGRHDEQDMDMSQWSAQRNMPMSNPLDSLFGNRMPTMPEAAGTTSDSAELVNRLLERILVAEPKGGGSEIRLMLNDDVLPGTEVHLLRSADGSLAVKLVTDNASSFQTLVAAQDRLREQLEGMEKDVRVEVMSETSGNDAEHGDMRQRSRGLPYEDGQA